MKVALSDIRKNPHRNLVRLPLNEDKVAALIHSINDTSFWDNLIGRKIDGHVEIAYGHHRIEALKRIAKSKKIALKDYTIDIHVRQLTDTEMVKIMSHENMGEWSHDAEFEVETVRSTLEAAAAGLVELPAIGGKPNNCRDLMTPRGVIKYSPASIAEFLGWKEYKIEAALALIEEVDAGVLSKDDVQGLTTKQAQVVVQQVRKAKKRTGSEKVAKEVGSAIAGGMKKGSGARYKETDKHADVTIHSAAKKADEIIARSALPKVERAKKVPDLDSFIAEMRDAVRNIFNTKACKRYDEIVAYKEHANPVTLASLADELRALAAVADEYADKMSPAKASNPRRLAHN